MTTPARRFFTLFLGPAFALSALAQADTPKLKSEESKARVITTAPAEEEVITLPKVEVTRSRIRQIDVEIRRLEKAIKRERKQLTSSNLDKALNDPAVAKAAALFGGKSTIQRESVAAERVYLMEAERDLLEKQKVPMTKTELELVQKQVEQLRTRRRELDLTLR